jgi:hypothetical protein
MNTESFLQARVQVWKLAQGFIINLLFGFKRQANLMYKFVILWPIPEKAGNQS